jgi:hypothetical protein
MDNPSIRTSCRHPQNRRAAKRLLCSDLIRVTWDGGHGSAHEEMAVVEDFSSQGASLFLGVRVPEKTELILHTPGGDLRGVCCHCGRAPNGYLAGVNFQSDAGEYEPRHLLDTSLLDFAD